MNMEQTAQDLVSLSKWINAGNADCDPETLRWIRVAKVAEESGEAIAALIGYTGANPRKGKTHDLADVIGELMDVAVTALAAVEHLDGHTGLSLDLLQVKIGSVYRRAVEGR